MSRYNILIVDDQRDVRLLLRTSLQTLQLDLEIVDVPSAEEALLVLGKEQIDLMVVDVRLPGMSGLELRAHAGKRMPTTQLILITGMTDENVKRQLAQAGVAAYFFKPIPIPLFLDKVCECLGVKPVTPVAKQDSGLIASPETIHSAGINLLAELCIRQAAMGGWLLSGQGKTLVEFGEIASPDEKQVLDKSMLNLLEHDRGQALSTPEFASPCHHLFPGQRRDLWITSLGADLVLAIALPAGEAAQKAAGLLSEIEKLGNSLATRDPAEAEHLLPSSREHAKDVAEEEIDTGELSDLLGQASGHSLGPEELDAYWDSLTREENLIHAGHGVFSYEEAVRLGLAPGKKSVG